MLRDSNKVDYEVVSMTDQIIHGRVSCEPLTLKFLFTTIYGLHTMEDRKSLATINNHISRCPRAMACYGDFNAILHPGDQMGGMMSQPLSQEVT